MLAILISMQHSLTTLSLSLSLAQTKCVSDPVMAEDKCLLN